MPALRRHSVGAGLHSTGCVYCWGTAVAVYCYYLFTTTRDVYSLRNDLQTRAGCIRLVGSIGACHVVIYLRGRLYTDTRISLIFSRSAASFTHIPTKIVNCLKVRLVSLKTVVS